MTTVIPFKSEKPPFILRATWRAGKPYLATLFSVTGIDVLTDEWVAVSTINPDDVRRFPQVTHHEDAEGGVCTVWATGQQAFAFAKDSGLRMATV